MAKHLDLEEQEQLAEIKHFWAQYGNLITWVLIAIFGTLAAFNGYDYWQRSKAAQASVMQDEIDKAALAGDIPKLERALADMKERFGTTVYADQASLLVAKIYFDQGMGDPAKAALSWVVKNSSDAGYVSVAKLRLSGLMLEAKSYAEASAALEGSFPKDFVPLVADRRGDIFAAQGKTAEAKAEYEKAYKAFDDRTDYRRLVEVKLNSLGVDPSALVAGSKAQPATAAASAATSAPASAPTSASSSATSTQAKP